MNSEKISEIIKSYKLPKFRGQQLRKAVFDKHISRYCDITTFPEKLRLELEERFPIITVQADRVLISQKKDAFKALLRLKDGLLIESVLLNTGPDLWTCCISCQVGCAFKCKFCATGDMGFLRNLTAEEISDQVLFWQFYMNENDIEPRLRNVVYMGMGEPFDNDNAVFDSIDELLNNGTFNMGARHISVSTVGIIDGINEFADRFPQVNLAISLHSANDKQRTALMPVNRNNNLFSIRKAVIRYLKKTNRKIFFEYILLPDENDSFSDADELIEYIQSYDDSYLIHVNLIVYNKTKFKDTENSRKDALPFTKYLLEHNIRVTIRKSLGQDINGACGQLIPNEDSVNAIS